MRFPSLLALVPGFLLLAGGASGQEYYADVRPVLVERCAGCHTEGGIAWSMDDAEQTLTRARAIAGAIVTGNMPPWIAEPGHQEYLGDLTLDADVIAMVADWRDAGFPPGDVRADPPSADSRMAGGTHDLAPDVSLDLIAGDAYLPDQSMTDDYRCFVVDWPRTERGFITGFRAVPGNLGVAHHVVVHAIRPEMASRYHELDEAEDGLGYQCFGGAVPDRLGNRAEREAYEAHYPNGVRELDNASAWLAHWAPGMYGHAFPEDTGILLEPGSALVVQMHYYTADAAGEADEGSRIEFSVADRVDRPAFHLSQTRNEWLAGERNGSMVIPAGETTSYETEENLGAWLPYIASLTDVDADRIQALELHSANLHMHAIGHSGAITLTRPDGRTETLLSVPEWDLHWQRDFTFMQPKVLPRDRLDGTRLRVRCTYFNPHDYTVYGGYGSYDEMCFNFSYVSVRVGEPSDRAPGGH